MADVDGAHSHDGGDGATGPHAHEDIGATLGEHAARADVDASRLDDDDDRIARLESGPLGGDGDIGENAHAVAAETRWPKGHLPPRGSADTHSAFMAAQRPRR